MTGEEMMRAAADQERITGFPRPGDTLIYRAGWNAAVRAMKAKSLAETIVLYGNSYDAFLAVPDADNKGASE